MDAGDNSHCYYKDVKIRKFCTKLLLPANTMKTELYRQLPEVSNLRIKKY